jgi:uncharacterized protein YhbP (UPF0306 family)
MPKDLSKLAKEIIENNQYMTIASSGVSGKAWVSTVAYAHDKKFTFYWASIPNSQHQQNIKQNPKIVFSIFDSHQLWGEGVGVQIEATAEEVGLSDISVATKAYFSRKYPYGNVLGSFGKGLKDLLKGKIYHFYKAIPTRLWVPDPDAPVDTRIEVFL